MDALESILPTLTFCDIEREGTESHLDPSINSSTERYADKEFLKAFQILQLIVEYLLYVQENLVINESHLRKELEHIRRRNETIETQWRSLSTRFEVFQLAQYMDIIGFLSKPKKDPADFVRNRSSL